MDLHDDKVKLAAFLSLEATFVYLINMAGVQNSVHTLKPRVRQVARVNELNFH
jgi:hypothetical protein